MTGRGSPLTTIAPPTAMVSRASGTTGWMAAA